jgi:hypothetical protein
MFIGFALRELCLHKELKSHSIFGKEIMITHNFLRLKGQIGQPHWPSSQFFSFGHKCLFVFASLIVLVIMNLCQWSLVISGFVLLVQAFVTTMCCAPMKLHFVVGCG